MIAATLDGEEALEARFEALPAEIIDALAAKAAALGEALADKVRNDKLSGGVLNAVSGALRESIVSDAGVDANGVFASIASIGDIPYAAIQEYGGKTAAHEIVAVKAEALAFMVGGALRFAKRVMHPGSTMPERSYLRSSLAQMADEIVTALAETPDDVWERL